MHSRGFTDNSISTPVAVSVVIPTLNEAAWLPMTLRSLAVQEGVGEAYEIIVVDGGSGDRTVRIAEAEATVKLIRSPPGRAKQMNAGAAAARGEVLLFVHGDTRLSPDALSEVIAATADPRCVGGAHRVAIHEPGPLLRLVATTVNLRSRLCPLPYGDQGIFVRRRVFVAMNGFADLPIMEDADLVMRLRRLGKIKLLDAIATTSGRRWKTYGVVRTTLVNWAAMILFKAGVSPHRIHAFYRRGFGCGQSPPHPSAASKRSKAELSRE